MSIRQQLLGTSNLVPPPVVEPLFDPKNRFAYPSRRGRDWTTATPQEIYDDINALFLYGVPGEQPRGLL